jgi:uncharacterized membrane protein YGL010W
MIVLAITTLLARPSAGSGPFAVSPAMLVAALAGIYYLRLDLRFGATMSAALALLLLAGHWLATQPSAAWLGTGAALFVIGWVFQFVGHYFEGRKPAFVDDLSGLLIGPLFVAAEAAFALGLRRPLQDAIEARVGPTRNRATPQKHATRASLNARRG